METLLRADLIGVVSSFIALVVWLATLKSEIRNTQKELNALIKEVDALIVKHDALDNKILNELSKIRESIVRLETIFNMFENNINGNVTKKKERS